jgi:hypothetical protein
MADPLLSGGGNLTKAQTETAHNEKSLGKQVGEYKINRIRIISPLRSEALGSDSFIDISEGAQAVWSEINFYEDIDNPTVTGDITIADAVGILEGVPILGEETLEVSFSTAGSLDNNIIINRFRIHRVDPPIKSNENFRSIKLHFVSDLVMKNIQVEVQKSFKGSSDTPKTISDIVRSIYYDSFCNDSKDNPNYETTKKEFKVEPTIGIYSVHIPNWTPFKAIQYLASKAQSSSNDANGAHFVFYETLKGYRFVSIETLMKGGFRNFDSIIDDDEDFRRRVGFNYLEHAQKESTNAFLPIYDKYTPEETRPSHVVKYIMRPANVGGDELEKRFSVTSLNVLNYPDTFRNLRSGMYANRVITHDLLSMTVHQRDYFYKKQKDVVRVDIDGITVLRENKNKTPEDTEVDIDNFTTAENGALCSEYADYLDRPQTHVSLFHTNRGISTKFGNGPTKKTVRDGEGNIVTGLSLKTRTLDGKPETAFPIETEKNIEQVLGKRISQQRQIESVRIQIEVPGDSAREVGDLIYFNHPSDEAEDKQSGITKEHKYLSGRYLITALRHKITGEEYTMIIEASKDSYLSEPSSGFKANIPKTQTPDGTGTVEDNVS